MKIKVKTIASRKDIKYPCLMKSPHGNYYIMQDSCSGVCIYSKDGSPSVGSYWSHLDGDSLELTSHKIIIRN